MATSIDTRLRAAQTSRSVIRVIRTRLEYRGGYLQGYVVGQGPALVLLNRVDPAMLLDGYAAIRRDDITEVSTSYEARSFVERALKLRGFKPKAPSRAFPLESIPLALERAQAQYPLVTVHRERSFRDSCWIGQVLRPSSGGFLLREISPSAEFKEQRWYRFSSVTCLEFRRAIRGRVGGGRGAAA